MKTRYAMFMAAVTLVLAVTTLAEAQPVRDSRARESNTVILYLENDLFGFENRDRYYTHGTKLSWISGDLSEYRDILELPSRIQATVDRLPYVNDPGDIRTVSLSLGQNIYTPEDKARGDLIVGDRPYAGITYLALGLHSRSTYRQDTFQIALGIVGPHSYARDCQLAIHRMIGSIEPEGWSHQLRNEPVLNFYLERKRRFLESETPGGWGYDLIPHLGIAVGNVLTGANTGVQARFGYNLPRDYGTYLIRPGSDSSAPVGDDDPRFYRPRQRLGMHLFVALDGKAVARNIFLDGNTFRNSHSVDKYPFLVDLVGGIGLIVHQFKITYSYVYRTKEFRGQSSEQQFGSISVSCTF